MGINTWDTANMYSNGVSEEIIGKALKKHKIPRHKVVIMTKCYWAACEDMGASAVPSCAFSLSLSLALSLYIHSYAS